MVERVIRDQSRQRSKLDVQMHENRVRMDVYNNCYIFKLSFKKNNEHKIIIVRFTFSSLQFTNSCIFSAASCSSLPEVNFSIRTDGAPMNATGNMRPFFGTLRTNYCKGR